MMTEHATHFIDPLTFRSLTHEPVAVGLFDDPSDPIHHISLAAEADVVLLAPCTANVMAKSSARHRGRSILHHPSRHHSAYRGCTRNECSHVRKRCHTNQYGNPQKHVVSIFVEADDGYLACGDVGRGRLAEPERIVSAVLDLLNENEESKKRLCG